MTADVGARIERARVAAGFSQRALADATGISQSTLSRVISGQRAAKVPELMAIGWATGATVAELAGTGTVAERAEGAARAINHADMDGMREALSWMITCPARRSRRSSYREQSVGCRDRRLRVCCAVPS